MGGYDDADCDGTPDGGVIADRVNPVRYLEQAYAAGAQGSFDAVGWHPYVFDFEGDSTMPELLEYDECSTWSQMAETPVSARSLMVANGDGDKTVWITEAGIPTCVFLALYPCVSRAEQAELLTTEFALWQTYDWAGGYIVYDLRDDCSSFLNVQCNFGVVTRGNNYKPAWVGLRTAWLNE